MDFCAYKFNINLKHFESLMIEGYVFTEQTLLDYGLINNVIGTPKQYRETEFKTIIKELVNNFVSMNDTSHRGSNFKITMAVNSTPPEWFKYVKMSVVHKIIMVVENNPKFHE